MPQEEKPLIIAFVADLFFTSRIESVAENLGFKVTLDDSIDLDRITRLHPALIIFDLNHQSIPWKDWIVTIKTSPATRRIPVLCFGSHLDKQKIYEARASGADRFVARSQFVNSLRDLILRYARQPDYKALRDSCQNTLSETAIHGLEEFNRGEYFEAHEILEAAWNAEVAPGKELYRAILQVAVAYYQVQRGNYPGAVKMFLRLRQWIDPLPDVCRGVDIAQLRLDAKIVYDKLLDSGPTRINEFDLKLLKPVIYKR
jgi:CheY-like chemotaxis protein